MDGEPGAQTRKVAADADEVGALIRAPTRDRMETSTSAAE